jgi:hypothetical protein
MKRSQLLTALMYKFIEEYNKERVVWTLSLLLKPVFYNYTFFIYDSTELISKQYNPHLKLPQKYW